MFDDAFDENLVLDGKGYTIDDTETLSDLGLPTAAKIDVVIHSSSYVVVIVVFPDYTDYYSTGKTAAEWDNYLSLDDLSEIILQKPAIN